MNIRVAHVKQLLKESNLDALLVSSVPNIFYLTNYHGFSYEEREAYLLICKNGQYIITDPRYSEAVKKKVADFQLMEISGGKTLSDILKELAKKHQIKKLGIEEDNLTVAEYKLISSAVNNLNHFTL
ncbi:MAG: aminopeptidase P family N-terminal domain-containing protein, partial [Patescibacteria group bacterium]